MSVRPSHIEYELQHLKSNEAEINILLQMAANRTPITPFRLSYRSILPFSYEHIPCEALNERKNHVDYEIKPSGDYVSSAFLQVDLPALPFAINQFFPLYHSSEDAKKNSPVHTCHSHTLNNQVYYMPDGVAMYHGNYTGNVPYYPHGLGDLLIERAELTLNKKIIQTLYPEYIRVSRIIHDKKLQNQEEMYHRFTDTTVSDLKMLSRTNRTLFIRLPFFFEQTPVPIQKILQQCGSLMRIRVYFRPASETIGGDNVASYAIPKSNKTLFIGNAILEQSEAEAIMDRDFQVVVKEGLPQHVDHRYGDKFENEFYENRLRLQRPITQLLFFGRNTDRQNVSGTTQQRIGSKRIMTSKVIYTSNDSKRTGKEEINGLQMPLDLFDYDTEFSNIQFDLEHHHRFPHKISSKYFTHVQNQFNYNTVRGVHNFSFAINPSDAHSFGNLNLSKIDDKVFRAKPKDRNSRIFLFAETLNIFFITKTSHGMTFY